VDDGKSTEGGSEPSRQTAAAGGKPGDDVQVASSELAKLGEKRPLWQWIAGAVVVALALMKVVPWVINASRTVSTDDAYINGHVTFVAPRVPGQVVRVLVDDNNRVRKGNLLVQLDKEPYRVQVEIANAAVTVAQADVVAAQAKVRGLAGLARSQRFDLDHSMEELGNQVANLRAKVAALQAANATLTRAQADYKREQQLLKHRVISEQEFDA